MWCCLTLRPRRVFFSSAKLPTWESAPTWEPGRRWLNGPTRAPSSTTAPSTIDAQTTQPAPIVDAEEPAVVLDGECNHHAPVGPGEGDQLGQIELARGRRRRQRADPAAQPGGIERVQTRVDLVDRNLRV